MTDSIAAIAIGYLLGSIPFGYIAGWMRGIDLREHGSHNTGGTNAVRVLGAKYGAPVIIADIAKGALAVVLAGQIGGTSQEVLAATAAVIGHAFPLFLHFSGGKAVATGAGAMVALVPPVGVFVMLEWVALALLTRYISVASMVSAASFPILCIATGQPWQVVAFTLAGAIFVFWRHRANIARLRAGNENRLNLRGAKS
jgi:glycerol-3-phosphate acyltransferase PlsY